MVLIYLIPLTLAAIWCVKYDRQAEMDSHKSHRFWLLCIILSLITGLSYALGGDKQTYLDEFELYSTHWDELANTIKMGLLIRGQMPGWVIINYVVKILFGSFYVVQLIEAFFVNIVVFYTAQKYTQRVFLFALLYCFTFTYFVFNTEVMREAFAIGFFLLGAETMFRKKWVATICLFAMAMLFHISAIVVFLLPFMRIRITPKRFLYILLASALFWLASNFLFKFLVAALLGQEGALVEKVLLYSTFSTGPIAFVIYAAIYLAAPFWIMHLGMRESAADPELIRRKEQFIAYYLCIAIIVPAFLPLARFLNYPRVIFLCLTADLLYRLFASKRHFITKLVCILLTWGYSSYQYIAINPITNSRFLDLFFPYTSILNEDYDRSHRKDLHSTTIGDEKSEENTRTVQ